MELSSVLALWSFQVARADLSSAAVNNLRSKSRAFEARSFQTISINLHGFAMLFSHVSIGFEGVVQCRAA